MGTSDKGPRRRPDRRIWPRNGANNCTHPDLPQDLEWDWAGRADYGRQKWQDKLGQPPTQVTIRKGEHQVTVPIYWNADRTPEPNETFCITIRGEQLPNGLQWEDPTRTTQPIILLNDDPG